MLKPYLEAGEFVTTHGITGELKLYPWSDDASFLGNFEHIYLSENGGNECKIEKARTHKNMCIVKIDGVNTIEQARAFIGKVAYIAREEIQLEPGRYFVQDILGCTVTDVDTGQKYGHLKEVTSPGRHDVYTIENEKQEVFYFPATEPFLCSIDIDKKEISVKPIAGMFEVEPVKEKAVKKKKPAKKGKMDDTN